MVQAIKKIIIKGNCDVCLEERVVAEKQLKLSSPNDFLNFLQMDEGTYEELLNWLGPNIQKQYT